MKLRLWHLPLRLATGAYILNSGLNKLTADDEEVHKRIHSMASDTYHVFERLEPRTFTRLLGAGETALGAVLLAPFIGSGLAGAGLTAFSAALLGLYFRTPGMTVDGIRPSQQGSSMAKDSWMAAIGTALMIDAATSRSPHKAAGSAKPGEEQ